MKKRNIQIVVILIALGVAIMFSSFGNTLSVEERSLVHAMGVDYEDGKYKVSLQVFKPSGSGSDTPVDVSQSNIQVVKSEGTTISEALDRAQFELGREIFMGHLQMIVFSRDVNFSDPNSLFSFCLKDKNIYLGVKLCMSDGKAEEIMQTQITRGTMPAESFSQTVEMNVKNANTINCELLDFLSCIESPQYICMPILSVKKEESSSDSQAESGSDGESSGADEPLIQIKETALIKGGKVLEDTLSTDEAKGVAWLIKRAKESKLVFEYEGKPITAAITDDGGKVWLSAENGKLVYNAKLTVVAHVAMDITDKEESEKMSEAIEKKFEELYKSGVEKAFIKNHVDVFGIWKLLRHEYPKSYLEYEGGLDEIYDMVEFKASTKVRIE